MLPAQQPLSPSSSPRWSTRLLSVIAVCASVCAVLQFRIHPVALGSGSGGDVDVEIIRGLAAASKNHPEPVVVSGRRVHSEFVANVKAPESVPSGVGQDLAAGSGMKPKQTSPTTISAEIKFYPTATSSQVENVTRIATERQIRILHIVTSSYIHRMGRDRLRGTVLPTLTSSVRSLFFTGRYSVDVRLILGYRLEPADRDDIVGALRNVHPDIGLTIWDDATPRFNGTEYHKALAMRHREVVKDAIFNSSLPSYDLFSCWEDDVLVGSRQVDRYLRLSREIDALAEMTSEKEKGSFGDDTTAPLSREQLLRMIPGFIRVEAVGVDRAHAAGKTDLECCNVAKEPRLMVWETRPEGFRIRHFPTLGTLGLLPVSNEPNRRAIGAAKIDPSAKSSDATLFGQQAGWMATREQVLRFEEERCVNHGFLPPFRGQAASALRKQSVEYWSGGFQLFGFKSGCAMQRVVQLDTPELWEEGLLWHTSNNKHKVKKVDNQRYWDAGQLRRGVLDRWEGNRTSQVYLVDDA